MTKALFVSDLHGHRGKYEKLFRQIRRERPSLVFLGGDLLPHGMLSLNALDPYHQDFISNYLSVECKKMKEDMEAAYPGVFIILGNDDPRFEEAALIVNGEGGLWTYVHNRRVLWKGFIIYGYSCVPPTPFLLKDWERFDVSRFVDVGCVSPLEGHRTFPVSSEDIENRTIKTDLESLTADEDLSRAIFLFHAPPYDTALDLADLAGKMVDHAPLDPHIGSIAVRRFIEERQPLLTLHGHAHETCALSGRWQENIGRTLALSAAHRGEELAVIRFYLEDPGKAVRVLL